MHAVLLYVLILSSNSHLEKDTFQLLDELYVQKEIDNVLIEDDKYSSDYSKEERNLIYFFVEIQNDEKVWLNEISSEEQKELSGALQYIREFDGESGIIKNSNLMFKKYSNDIYGIIDSSHEQAFMYRQIREYTQIIVSSFILFIVVSVLLSYIVVKPIEKMWQKQQQFVMDASHELKTPLTVIKGNASILTDGIDEHQQKWLSNIDQEVQYMEKLIEDLLLLAKFDNTMKQELFTSVNLSRIIEETVMKFEPMLFDEGLTVVTDIDPAIEIEGIESYIRRLCVIFLDNAKKYSYEGTTVFVGLKRRGKECIMTVGNSGDILSKDDISKIFNRFYMVNQSRKRNSHGLGLAIANEIIKIHKAKVVVKSNADTGNQFIATFDII